MLNPEELAEIQAENKKTPAGSLRTYKQLRAHADLVLAIAAAREHLGTKLTQETLKMELTR